MMQKSVEGVELTEALVLTRTRAPDLESVKKLNCWASHIKDVQVVRRMPNLEVCSLSINHITSLRDFAHCHRLKELYVRTNSIQRLEDIHYLKHLPRLRSLWLSENPCANSSNYRSTVLRSLPNLHKLDNTAVTPEELEVAQVEGDDIPVPDDFSSSSFFTSPLNDTQSSIGSSVESGAFPRKKREQRRQRLAAEEAARSSREDRSCSSSSRSEEEHSSCEKSDDASASKYDSDAGSQKGKGSVSESEDVKESVQSPIRESVHTPVSDSEEGSDAPEQLEEVDVVMSDSETNNLSLITDNNKQHAINIEKEESGNEDVSEKHPLEKNNNNNVNEDHYIEEEKKSEANAEVIEDITMNSNTENKSSSNPLLDKIRLNDSLNCVDSQDVVESIALDDLVIELTSETEKNVVKSADEAKDDSSVLGSSPESDTNESKTDIDTQSRKSDSYSAARDSREKADENKEENEVVDWEEHNRLRAELGVKQMERTSTKSFHNDVNRIRNSNILQAVLSLVKELDKDSLDIVSSAVQTRLEKLHR